MSRNPEWLKRLVERVCGCIDLLQDAPPIGCHFAEHDDTWEVTVFVASTEIVGGVHDGRRIPSLFVADLSQVLLVFESVESCGWQPHRVDKEDELGAHVAIHGQFEGHQVWLRILAEAPEKFEAGRHANLLDRMIVDVW